MYKCQACLKTSKLNEAAHRVVFQTRSKDYYEDGRLIGKGWEIVSEFTVCSECKPGYDYTKKPILGSEE